MSPPKPTPPPLFDGPMYPLASAEIRIRVLAVACWTALDRALRKLHDGPGIDAVRAENPDLVFPAWLGNTLRVNHVARYHLRMKVDERTCRWCGLAATEARAELEAEDELA